VFEILERFVWILSIDNNGLSLIIQWEMNRSDDFEVMKDRKKMERRKIWKNI